MKIIFILFVLTLLALGLFTYGFVDPNLHLSSTDLLETIHQPLAKIVFNYRSVATGIYSIIILLLFLIYVLVLRRKKLARGEVVLYIGVAVGTLVLAFPAFSYDIFNYMLTAKVAFGYKENPYLVMPIEIPNEPMLAFTRGANKVALYGPTWIGLTLIPHILGMGSIWGTITALKAVIAVFYLVMCWLIYKKTNAWWNVVFFALNPLVLIEVLVSAHNDIVMMVLAVGGVILLEQKRVWLRTIGVLLWFISIFIKGATLVLLPVFFLRDARKRTVLAFWLMVGVFLLTPLREELYPWYGVWFLSFAALLPHKRGSILHEGSMVLSFGLLLRYIPYIYTREYGGYGPLVRAVVTIAPLAIFCFLKAIQKYRFRRP